MLPSLVLFLALSPALASNVPTGGNRLRTARRAGDPPLTGQGTAGVGGRGVPTFLYDPLTRTSNSVDPSQLVAGPFLGPARQAGSTAAAKAGTTPDDLANGKPLKGKESQAITAVINGQWQYFAFGPVGTDANPSFVVSSPDQYIRVRITDLYLPGDIFAIDNFDGDRTELVRTPPVNVNGSKMTTTNPQVAFKSHNVWSKVQLYLPPGKYHLIVRTVSTVRDGGQGAIRFDLAGNLANASPELARDSTSADICAGYGGFAVVRHKVLAATSGTVCKVLGLLPADLATQDDLEAASETSSQCLSRGKYAWVNSYNKNAYDGLLAIAVTKDNKLRLDTIATAEEHVVMCRVPQTGTGSAATTSKSRRL